MMTATGSDRSITARTRGSASTVSVSVRSARTAASPSPRASSVSP
jgi:hypothetical protein